MAKQYTNREDVFLADPENWEYVPNADKTVGGAEATNPVYAPGATEPTTSAPGAVPGEPFEQPAKVPADPRLGMNPQGAWTAEKMQAMFPEMFKLGAEQYKAVPSAIPGFGQDERPPILKMTRDQWETHVFKTIGGNPFLTNPYDAVVQSDADLPELFNYVFQGRVTWADLPKLDKDERAYWEKIKKEYHERTYKEALGKQKQMAEAYKWMMGQWAYEQKQAAAELAAAKNPKGAPSDKAPTIREGYDNQTGEKILLVWDSDSRRWIPSLGADGRPVRTEAATLDSYLSPKARFAASELNKLQEGLPQQIQAVIGAMKEGPEKDRLVEQFSKKLTPEEKERKAKWQAIYDKEVQKLQESGVIETPKVAPGKGTLPPLQSTLAQVVQFIKANRSDPRIPAIIAQLKKDYSGVSGSAERIDKAVEKLGIAAMTPKISTEDYFGKPPASAEKPVESAIKTRSLEDYEE